MTAPRQCPIQRVDPASIRMIRYTDSELHDSVIGMGPLPSGPGPYDSAIDATFASLQCCRCQFGVSGRKKGVDMGRTILVAGILPFISAFLDGGLAFGLVAAPQATAQSSEAQEVRASAFIVVGPDGAVLARLGAGGAGSGNLSLYDAAGTTRVAVAGGFVSIWDGDGNLALRAGRTSGIGGQPRLKWDPARPGRVGEHDSASAITDTR